MIKLLTLEEIEKYKKQISDIYKEVFKADDFSANFLITRIDDSLKNNIKAIFYLYFQILKQSLF